MQDITQKHFSEINKSQPNNKNNRKTVFISMIIKSYIKNWDETKSILIISQYSS